ncbi:MAG: Gfo/Idh/MocA family oxidoreductase [Candidatus Omnitrophica bacterium]|nr:Gfo/Idh/MocA family oxidoreductase [Candidatus Omnitrophota bacterium]
MSDKKKILIFVGEKPYHPSNQLAEIIKDQLKDYEILIEKEKNVFGKDIIFNYDSILIYADNTDFDGKQEENIIKYVKNGGGLVGIHSTGAYFKKNKKFKEMLGCEFIGHSPVFPFELKSTSSHYINRRIPSKIIDDEFYFLNLSQDAEILFNGYWQGKLLPLGYTRNYGNGRIFYFAPCHSLNVIENKDIIKTIKRAIIWTAKEEKKEKEIKCGIIGYGPAFNMGKHHAALINSTYGMKVIAFFDLNKERMEQAKKDFPESKTYTDLKEFLKDEEIELAIIVTPHNTHKDLAISCLNSGKNVIVEKPMCIKLKEADEMIETANKKGLMLSVFHNRRWDGDFLAIEKIVKSEEIGKIFNVEIFMGGYGMPKEWWRSEKEISGGIFYDWGAHFLYWLLTLIPSKIKNVYGVVQKRKWFNFSNEDEVKSIVTFENGEVADIQSSSIASIPKPRWRILGEKGGIIQTDIIKVYKYEDGLTEKIIPPMQTEWYRFYNNIADHLIFGEELEIDIYKARNVIGIIDKTLESAEKGKLIEFNP